MKAMNSLHRTFVPAMVGLLLAVLTVPVSAQTTLPSGAWRCSSNSWNGWRACSRARCSRHCASLATASGNPSKSEVHGYGQNEFVPWQLGAVM